MLPAEHAESLILNLVQPLNSQRDVETVGLLAAAGRILATPVVSNADFPHWDNSAMDGYAVRFEDVRNCNKERPVILEVVEEIPAGYQPQKAIQPGQAARILTGSMMPDGADTVVIQEVTQLHEDLAEPVRKQVSIFSAPKPGEFVRRKAEFYRAGDRLLTTGLTLAAPEIAVLAATQCVEVPVYRRPRVAIFSTGDELVSPDQPLKPGQIVDSNQYALATLVTQAGAEPILLGVVPDQPDLLKEAIAQAISTADVVLSSGGVSVGDYDYVDRILEALGADIHIRAVAVKPGKPLTVATFKQPDQHADQQAPTSHSQTLYFGLPGNPVSALVSFWRFVLPALHKLSGKPDSWGAAFVEGRSPDVLRSDGKRETYLWGRLHLINGSYEFRLSRGSHSSGNLINLAQTNSLAVIPIGQTHIAAGEPIRIMHVR